MKTKFIYTAPETELLFLKFEENFLSVGTANAPGDMNVWTEQEI